MISLQIFRKKKLIETKNYDKLKLSIGRAIFNDVTFNSKIVSNVHARILLKDDDCFIIDLGSSNGTFIDGSKIKDSTEIAIKPDNVITIGEFYIKIKVEFNTKEKQISPPKSSSTDDDPLQQKIKSQILTKLQDEIDLRRHDISETDEKMLKSQCRPIVINIINGMKIPFSDSNSKEELICDILDEAIALGPLEYLIHDEKISEIMVTRKDRIYIEKEGKIILYPKTFTSDESLLGVISRMVSPVGRRVDESSPYVDVSLKDGSRVNIIIPPLSLDGPCITIRKFSNKNITMEHLVQWDTLNHKMKILLELFVKNKTNIIISGGTGSGKTTTLNALGEYIPRGERLISIEDTAELQLNKNHDHVPRLQVRPPNIEGQGEVTIRALVNNALRMRPDRIICGECRGGEAYDCLQAMSTGHDGSMLTIHANSPKEMLSRLGTMVAQAGLNLASHDIKEVINSAVHVIIQQNRFECGSRKITKISEVTGIDDDGNLLIQDIFYFKRMGVDQNNKIKGSFMATGRIPEIFLKLHRQGIDLDLSIFNNN